MSLFTQEKINQELAAFMEWPTADQSSVTTTSAILFAEHIQKKATEHLLAELEQYKRMQEAFSLMPMGWANSLTDCFPAESESPEREWLIGCYDPDEEGSRYGVICVDAYQYDHEGDSESIAKAILALLNIAQQQAEVKP